MKAATVSELKKALVQLDHEELLDACVRLAKFKVENKELLTYLLMKSDDEQGYANELCAEIDQQLPSVKSMHKKTLRKIIRWMEKCIRFSGDKETELQVRIHLCRRFVDRGISFGRCRVSANMYASQLKKIDKALQKVHPDLQFDFRQQMDQLDSVLR
tara:strand:- start:64 stop:537 length:474 start_codon:yes stop_codon:yes gene_type:complete